MAQISPVRRQTPTMLTSSHSSRAHTMSPREQLLKLLDQGSDVMLVFTGADGTVEEVPAHSQILQQWSEVLAGALSTERSSSNTRVTSIPMDGTGKEDWLLAMEFIYPVVPLSEVTWDKVEALLRVGNRYSMHALMHRVSAFFSHHKSELQLEPGKLSVWRWVEKLDRYGLTAAAKECIDCQRDVASLIDAGPPDCLSSLSNGMLQHLVKASWTWMAKPAARAGQKQEKQQPAPEVPHPVDNLPQDLYHTGLAVSASRHGRRDRHRACRKFRSVI